MRFTDQSVQRWRQGLLAVSALLTLLACTQPGQATGDASGDSVALISAWESPLYLDHPLVGTIWRVSDQRIVTAEEFTDSLSESSYLLLGEKHDNPDHHQLQLNVLRHLLGSNLVTSVSFEMMDSSFADRLASLELSGFDSLQQLKEALQWDEAGWDWDFYGPLVAEALNAGVSVQTANLSGERIGQVYGEPLEPQIAGVLDALALEQMNSEIDESHCNMLPPSQFPAMVRVQQARDHAMASSLAVNDPAGRLNILLAGNYHVRRDLGVPRYLRALDPEIEPDSIFSLALLEVDPDSTDPMDYLQAYSDLLPFDYVWFTPAITDEDYCAGFSSQ